MTNTNHTGNSCGSTRNGRITQNTCSSSNSTGNNYICVIYMNDFMTCITDNRAGNNTNDKNNNSSSSSSCSGSSRHTNINTSTNIQRNKTSHEHTRVNTVNSNNCCCLIYYYYQN